MNPNQTLKSTAPPRRRSRWLRSAIVTFGLMFVLLSGAWFAARHFVLQGIDNWRTQQAALGNQWTCADPRLEGFPIALEYQCGRMTLTTPAPNGGLDASAQGVTLTGSLLHPLTLRARLQGPFNVHSADGALNIFAKAKTFAVDVGFGGRGVEALAIMAVDLVVDDESARAALGQTRIDALSFDAHPAADDALALTFSLDGFATPALARATGVGDPSALSLTSRIEKLSLLGRGDFVASLDGWRAASGQVAIQSLSAKQGAMSFSADGALSLDEAHRPQGNLNVAASGIEPLLRRWGVSPTATALTGVLGNLLGGRSSQPQAAPTIKLPLRLRDGSVFIGPIRAPVALLPLY